MAICAVDDPMSRPQFNINTLFLSIIMALSGWTLRSVLEVREDISGMKVQIKNLERIVYKAAE